MPKKEEDIIADLQVMSQKKKGFTLNEVSFFDKICQKLKSSLPPKYRESFE